MARSSLYNLKIGEKDLAGYEVIDIFVLSPPRYAVYRAGPRVMIQFSDDPEQARKQHAMIAPLTPLRGQLDGMIDAWRSNPDTQARAERFTKRVVDAVTLALEENGPDALALLGEIRDDIVSVRKSVAATDYLLVAAASAAVLIMLLAIVSSQWFPFIRRFPEGTSALWTGASGGVLGAFFSIATGMRNRTILPDLQQADNRRDAVLRMIIGTIGGGILIALFHSKLVALGGIDANSLHPRSAGYSDIAVLLVGFIAGFSERAVPDLLAKSDLTAAGRRSGDGATANDMARNVTLVPAPPPAAAQEDDLPPAPGEQDEEDQCLEHQPVDESEATEDADLPAASGGVAPKEEG